eukprot:3831808-Pyramimonas_sp.AAC.1
MLLAPKELAKKWHLSEQARVALRTSTIGGQWSQARLHKHGYATDNWCQYCRDCPGTVHHRLWVCPLLQQETEAAVDAGIIQAARASPHNGLLFTRGLMPRGALPAVPPPAT